MYLPLLSAGGNCFSVSSLSLSSTIIHSILSLGYSKLLKFKIANLKNSGLLNVGVIIETDGKSESDSFIVAGLGISLARFTILSNVSLKRALNLL